MEPRIILCTNQMVNLEINQQAQPHLHPEPSLLSGSMSNLSQPNIHAVLPVGVNTTNFEVHQSTESHESHLFHGMMQYHDVHRHHPANNVNLGVATGSSYYNPLMASSGVRLFPLHQNHSSPDQFPSSSNHEIVGVPTDNFGRTNHFVDGSIGPFKRKNTEGFTWNFQYQGAIAGSSSAIAPLSTRPLEPGVPPINAASFSEFRGNRNRAGATELDSALAHNTNHLIQARYMGQPLQTASPPWLDQQFGSSSVDGGAPTWNQAPAMSHFPGSNNFGVPVYQETAGNRTFFHLSPMPQGHHGVHHPPPPVLGVRSHIINFHSQQPGASHIHAANSNSAISLNPFQSDVEGGPRLVGPVPPTGFRIHRPHRQALMSEATTRHRNLPHLRVLPTDEVAMLEISGYYEVGSSIDHHSEMRLDIDHMSYEELLALGEQIGNVGTGLSEETITSHLKTRTHVLSKICANLEAAASVDNETDFCVICQTEYKNQEKIGSLDCGHDYHVGCIKRWLLMKNTCPICKSSALLTTERDDRAILKVG